MPQSSRHKKAMPTPVKITSIIILLAWLFCGLPAWAAAGQQPSVAFFYGPHPPVDVLQSFDWVVVQPYSDVDPRQADTAHTRYFAYVSLGEMGKASPLAASLPASCHLGTDAPWNSWVVDQASTICRQFYLDRVIKPLLARGFNGFFLDTLDSYRLTLKQSDAQAAYRSGLVALIRDIRRLDPRATFILNRGFELLPALQDVGVVGVAAESLYQGWDQARQRYVTVKPDDTKWLLGQLRAVRKSGLVSIAIDYLPPNRQQAAELDAKRIEADGIVPYVTNASLDIVGTSTVRVLPRRVLLLYSGDEDAMHNNANWYAAMPLNHMGYATRSIDVSKTPLPDGLLTGQVAGIVTWFNTDDLANAGKVYAWLRRQMAAGVPVALLGQFGFPMDAAHLAPLGLDVSASPAGLLKAHIVHADDAFVGFEGSVLPSAPNFLPLSLQHGRSLLDISVGGHNETAVALTPWGGYALTPYVVRTLPQGNLPDNMRQSSWVLNPFRFLAAALHLPSMPVPDTTTASGRRLLFAQIDGDGFGSKSWDYRYRDQLAGQVILDQILKRFRVPTSASVIASEFSDDGLYPPKEVARLRPVARKTFKLPWIEIGSHTYSHPFDWPALERDPGLSAGLHLGKDVRDERGYVRTLGLKYGYNLPVPGYRFDPHMEISGAIDIINRLLAPPGKHVRIIQWSGDTDPNAEVLALAYKAGVMNINGLNSNIDHARPSLTNVAPLGVWKGAHFQVFAPDANEDTYTNGWQPPYCGYRKVIQTFEMTDRPRRLAPIDIYYHFYSGARTCALNSLQTVYRWALAQKTTPVFPSTYSHIALGFEQAAIARDGNGFLIRGYGQDQTLRIPSAMGYPDIATSRNIAGFDDHGDIRYIHLGPGDNARLVLTQHPAAMTYLQSANGLIQSLGSNPDGMRIMLAATATPLSFTLANAARCKVTADGRPIHGQTQQHLTHYRIKQSRAKIAFACPRR
ncbi:hypothetical protein BI364_03220 [Acidihalobacter yilgarnensis]|uniref:Glycoside-hydrolase family GH114 TIM-barrel domain-containing protein n=1 Tax=Acidihalobacter yilgarnensis TaxID=2819280 RepID=A0A1D8IL05_9GAMM|nr:endo alpha-1,4 polygalactosaminidase [Acidihalobacter yilgarnensis]AOU97144.1 hypothetical protein BI364_03220 [Acidihalobacter yilgarnensis]